MNNRLRTGGAQGTPTDSEWRYPLELFSIDVGAHDTIYERFVARFNVYLREG